MDGWIRTGGVVQVEARGEGVEAPADGEEEIRRDGHAGDEVLVYERLLLQLLVLRLLPGDRVERGGAAEGEDGGGGAVVGCRRQGGKGHRHICCSRSLSSASCLSGLSFNVPCSCLLLLALPGLGCSVSFPLSL